MGKNKQYSMETKRNIVRKFLSQKEYGILAFSKQENIPESTVRGWIKLPQLNNPSSALKTTERFQLLLEYLELDEADKGLFLRKHGIYSHQIEEWKSEFTDNLKSTNRMTEDKTQRAKDKARIKELEKELRRKDKALAEVSALLILKKKADLLFQETDEED
ncbi:MAG: hypothetical protein KC646_18270 [Candidatus Cloacimonetes bacterium]|nr:hypothetical protein [Candidatus Cloacimonadota bacterium]